MRELIIMFSQKYKPITVTLFIIAVAFLTFAGLDFMTPHSPVDPQMASSQRHVKLVQSSSSSSSSSASSQSVSESSSNSKTKYGVIINGKTYSKEIDTKKIESKASQAKNVIKQNAPKVIEKTKQAVSHVIDSTKDAVQSDK
jgi:cytoskeletal protein RodZ